jgi:hypothetical protein
MPGSFVARHSGRKDGGYSKTSIKDAPFEDIKTNEAKEKEGNPDQQAVDDVGTLHRSNEGFGGGEEV